MSGLFRLLDNLIPDYRLANLIAIVLTKLYGYFINKLFVFRSHHLSSKQLLREILSYIAARGFTALVDYFGLILLVSVIGIEAFPAKIAVQGIVIVLNYVLGKLEVFRQAGRSNVQNDNALIVYEEEKTVDKDKTV